MKRTHKRIPIRLGNTRAQAKIGPNAYAVRELEPEDGEIYAFSLDLGAVIDSIERRTGTHAWTVNHVSRTPSALIYEATFCRASRAPGSSSTVAFETAIYLDRPRYQP